MNIKGNGTLFGCPKITSSYRDPVLGHLLSVTLWPGPESVTVGEEIGISLARVCMFDIIFGPPIRQVWSRLRNVLPMLTAAWWKYNELSREIFQSRPEKILAHLLMGKVFSRFFPLCNLLSSHLESLSEECLCGGDVVVDGVLRLVLLGDGERAEPRVQCVAAHVKLQERALLGLLLRRNRDLKRTSLRQEKKGEI